MRRRDRPATLETDTWTGAQPRGDSGRRRAPKSRTREDHSNRVRACMPASPPVAAMNHALEKKGNLTKSLPIQPLSDTLRSGNRLKFFVWIWHEAFLPPGTTQTAPRGRDGVRGRPPFRPAGDPVAQSVAGVRPAVSPPVRRPDARSCSPSSVAGRQVRRFGRACQAPALKTAA